jgi:hypothetical protein
VVTISLSSAPQTVGQNLKEEEKPVSETRNIGYIFIQPIENIRRNKTGYDQQ